MTALGDSARCDLCGLVATGAELDAGDLAADRWKRFASPKGPAYVDVCPDCQEKPIRVLVEAMWDAGLRGLLGGE